MASLTLVTGNVYLWGSSNYPYHAEAYIDTVDGDTTSQYKIRLQARCYGTQYNFTTHIQITVGSDSYTATSLPKSGSNTYTGWTPSSGWTTVWTSGNINKGVSNNITVRFYNDSITVLSSGQTVTLNLSASGTLKSSGKPAAPTWLTVSSPIYYDGTYYMSAPTSYTEYRYRNFDGTWEVTSDSDSDGWRNHGQSFYGTPSSPAKAWAHSAVQWRVRNYDDNYETGYSDWTYSNVIQYTLNKPSLSVKPMSPTSPVLYGTYTDLYASGAGPSDVTYHYEWKNDSNDWTSSTASTQINAKQYYRVYASHDYFNSSFYSNILTINCQLNVPSIAALNSLVLLGSSTAVQLSHSGSSNPSGTSYVLYSRQKGTTIWSLVDSSVSRLKSVAPEYTTEYYARCTLAGYIDSVDTSAITIEVKVVTPDIMGLSLSERRVTITNEKSISWTMQEVSDIKSTLEIKTYDTQSWSDWSIVFSDKTPAMSYRDGYMLPVNSAEVKIRVKCTRKGCVDSDYTYLNTGTTGEGDSILAVFEPEDPDFSCTFKNRDFSELTSESIVVPGASLYIDHAELPIDKDKGYLSGMIIVAVDQSNSKTYELLKTTTTNSSVNNIPVVCSETMDPGHTYVLKFYPCYYGSKVDGPGGASKDYYYLDDYVITSAEFLLGGYPNAPEMLYPYNGVYLFNSSPTFIFDVSTNFKDYGDRIVNVGVQYLTNYYNLVNNPKLFRTIENENSTRVIFLFPSGVEFTSSKSNTVIATATNSYGLVRSTTFSVNLYDYTSSLIRTDNLLSASICNSKISQICNVINGFDRLEGTTVSLDDYAVIAGELATPATLKSLIQIAKNIRGNLVNKGYFTYKAYGITHKEGELIQARDPISSSDADKYLGNYVNEIMAYLKTYL